MEILSVVSSLLTMTLNEMSTFYFIIAAILAVSVTVAAQAQYEIQPSIEQQNYHYYQPQQAQYQQGINFDNSGARSSSSFTFGPRRVAVQVNHHSSQAYVNNNEGQHGVLGYRFHQPQFGSRFGNAFQSQSPPQQTTYQTPNYNPYLTNPINGDNFSVRRPLNQDAYNLNINYSQQPQVQQTQTSRRPSQTPSHNFQFNNGVPQTTDFGGFVIGNRPSIAQNRFDPNLAFNVIPNQQYQGYEVHDPNQPKVSHKLVYTRPTQNPAHNYFVGSKNEGPLVNNAVQALAEVPPFESSKVITTKQEIVKNTTVITIDENIEEQTITPAPISPTAPTTIEPIIEQNFQTTPSQDLPLVEDLKVKNLPTPTPTIVQPTPAAPIGQIEQNGFYEGLRSAQGNGLIYDPNEQFNQPQNPFQVPQHNYNLYLQPTPGFPTFPTNIGRLPPNRYFNQRIPTPTPQNNYIAYQTTPVSPIQQTPTFPANIESSTIQTTTKQQSQRQETLLSVNGFDEKKSENENSGFNAIVEQTTIKIEETTTVTSYNSEQSTEAPQTVVNNEQVTELPSDFISNRYGFNTPTTAPESLPSLTQIFNGIAPEQLGSDLRIRQPGSAANVQHFHQPGLQQDVFPFEQPGHQQGIPQLQQPGIQQGVPPFQQPGIQQGVPPFQQPGLQQGIQEIQQSVEQKGVQQLQHPELQQNIPYLQQPVQQFQQPLLQQNEPQFQQTGLQGVQEIQQSVVQQGVQQFQQPEIQQNIPQLQQPAQQPVLQQSEPQFQQPGLQQQFEQPGQQQGVQQVHRLEKVGPQEFPQPGLPQDVQQQQGIQQVTPYKLPALHQRVQEFQQQGILQNVPTQYQQPGFQQTNPQYPTHLTTVSRNSGFSSTPQQPISVTTQPEMQTTISRIEESHQVINEETHKQTISTPGYEQSTSTPIISTTTTDTYVSSRVDSEGAKRVKKIRLFKKQRLGDDSQEDSFESDRISKHFNNDQKFVSKQNEFVTPESREPTYVTPSVQSVTRPTIATRGRGRYHASIAQRPTLRSRVRDKPDTVYVYAQRAKQNDLEGRSNNDEEILTTTPSEERDTTTTTSLFPSRRTYTRPNSLSSLRPPSSGAGQRRTYSRFRPVSRTFPPQPSHSTEEAPTTIQTQTTHFRSTFRTETVNSIQENEDQTEQTNFVQTTTESQQVSSSTPRGRTKYLSQRGNGEAERPQRPVFSLKRQNLNGRLRVTSPVQPNEEETQERKTSYSVETSPERQVIRRFKVKMNRRLESDGDQDASGSVRSSSIQNQFTKGTNKEAPKLKSTLRFPPRKPLFNRFRLTSEKSQDSTEPESEVTTLENKDSVTTIKEEIVTTERTLIHSESTTTKVTEKREIVQDQDIADLVEDDQSVLDTSHETDEISRGIVYIPFLLNSGNLEEKYENSENDEIEEAKPTHQSYETVDTVQSSIDESKVKIVPSAVPSTDSDTATKIEIVTSISQS